MSAIDPPVDTGSAEPTAVCPYCDRPFAAERGRDLHVGEQHANAMTEEDRTAYEAAEAAERDDLYFYHIKVVIAIGAIYSITVVAYMVAIGSDLL